MALCWLDSSSWLSYRSFGLDTSHLLVGKLCLINYQTCSPCELHRELTHTLTPRPTSPKTVCLELLSFRVRAREMCNTRSLAINIVVPQSMVNVCDHESERTNERLFTIDIECRSALQTERDEDVPHQDNWLSGWETPTAQVIFHCLSRHTFLFFEVWSLFYFGPPRLFSFSHSLSLLFRPNVPTHHIYAHLCLPPVVVVVAFTYRLPLICD